MKTQRTAPARKKHSLLGYLPQGMLIVAAAVALWQHQRTRRSVNEIRPPDKAPLPTAAPHVSIILPVRNEAANIDACLASLTAQDYPDYTIMVIDDGSTDSTPERLKAWCKRDSHIQMQRVERLPSGWAGKAHALHTGVPLTQGEWLLFTDADTRHAPQTLRLMIGHAQGHQDDLLSMSMNLMTLSGPAMPLLMPITEILLALRVTPSEIKDSASPRAFAFGQYILLRREAYLATGGYGAPGMRTSAVEDLALAEHIKHSGGQVEIVDGRGLLSNLQWTSWNSARQGWGKSCYSEFIRSEVPLAGLPAALALIAYGVGPSGVLLYTLATRKARRSSVLLASLTLLAQIDAKRRFDKVYGLSRLWALTAPIGWLVCGIMTLDVTRVILTGRRTAWKGRQIPKQERAVRPQTTRLSRLSTTTLAIVNKLRDLDYDKSISSGGSSDSAGGTA
jgi:chlorobactene glucosyltransferase